MGGVTVSVVGLRGHARRHIDILRELPDCELGPVYYPKPLSAPVEGTTVTTDLADCTASDAIVIASPTPVHAQQLRELAGYTGYILVEKPAVDRAEDMDWLLSRPDQEKGRMQVAFNFVHSELGRLLERVVTTGLVGEPVQLEVHLSHGLAFREGWKESWRARGSGLGVVETLGIHWVHLARRLFGEIERCEIMGSRMAGGNALDSGQVALQLRSGVTASIFTSYAAPQGTRFELWGTDGVFEYDGSVATLRGPRDTFDDAGRFARPPILETQDLPYDAQHADSLRRQDAVFVEQVRAGGSFDPRVFDQDVELMGLMLAALPAGERSS